MEELTKSDLRKIIKGLVTLQAAYRSHSNPDPKKLEPLIFKVRTQLEVLKSRQIGDLRQ